MAAVQKAFSSEARSDGFRQLCGRVLKKYIRKSFLKKYVGWSTAAVLTGLGMSYAVASWTPMIVFSLFTQALFYFIVKTDSDVSKLTNFAKENSSLITADSIIKDSQHAPQMQNQQERLERDRDPGQQSEQEFVIA